MDRIKNEANPDPEALNELLFTDDQILINEDEKAIQEHMSNLNDELKHTRKSALKVRLKQ